MNVIENEDKVKEDKVKEDKVNEDNITQSVDRKSIENNAIDNIDDKVSDENDGINSRKREKTVLQASVLGVILNLILFGIKFFAGTISHSVSITADAFNNLSDTGSSIIALVGTKMANRPADETHPYGHGRMEYIASFVVSIIVLNLAMEFCKSSISKIIHPVQVEFNKVIIAILLISIVIKVILGIYNRRLSKKINSTTLKAVATDAFGDAIITSAILISMLVAKGLGINIDGFVGIIISIIIGYAGYELVREAISLLLGEAPDEKVINDIKEELESQKGIISTHDLKIHNYGAGNILASVHAYVDSNARVVDVHENIDKAERYIKDKLGVDLVIHMDPVCLEEKKRV